MYSTLSLGFVSIYDTCIKRSARFTIKLFIGFVVVNPVDPRWQQHEWMNILGVDYLWLYLNIVRQTLNIYMPRYKLYK